MSPVRALAPAVLILIAVLLQVSIVERIGIGTASPDLVVLVIVSVALLGNAVTGAVYGFIGGVLLSLCAALLLGPHAIIATVIGFWAGRWGEVLITDEHPVPPFLAGIVATFAMQVGRPLIDFLVSPYVTTTQGIWRDALVVTGLNALLVLPVYILVRRVLYSSVLDNIAEAVEA